jgi:hypothetical protein
VLFFEKGDTGLSWSIHDYSEWGKSNQKGKWNEEGQFRRCDRKDYRWTADQVRQKAKYAIDAPATTPTTEHEYWCERICEYNRDYHVSDTARLKPSTDSFAEDKPTLRTAKAIIDEYFNLSSETFNLTSLAHKASPHKRKIDGAGVSLASVSRIYNGKNTGDAIREAVAAVISELVPCTRHDLSPPGPR